jgi:crotonobetainyl-CoA:carnitine CoA-transferase CaiB-like acyl-CoA transferase
MQLADLGADVIKVEQPGRGDATRHWGPPWIGEGEGRQSAYFISVNRNKRSLTLNLKREEGRAIARRLAARSDVLVENFKVGAAARWGLDYETLRAANPGLIYCAISGYGQTGPDRERPGYDFVVQAEGGVMSITGPAEGPPSKVGVAVSDVVAGLYATTAVLAALRHREQTGEGQYIDVALFDAQLAWLANVASNYLVSGETPGRYGNAHPNIVPYQTFATADGHLALGVGSDGQFRRLCAVLARPSLAEDPRFRTNPERVAHREALVAELEKVFQTRPTADWIGALRAADIPAAPINDVGQALSHPQAAARDMVTAVAHPQTGAVPLVNSPLNLSATPPTIRRPPPLLGEQTTAVLAELGYDAADIERLQEQGIV